MRRLSVWGILLLVGVLSASHPKVSLLPFRSLPSAPRQEDPRPSRGDLPRSSILAAEIEVDAVDRTEPADHAGFGSSRTSPCRNGRDIELSRFTSPDYLQPQIFRAHSADLPPPSPLLLRS